ncbi:hypothetical protein ACFTAO_30235 [Paenibacillus rhizoplanae]
MDYKGFILHHSRCPSINGKGFDFWVGLNGSVYAAPLLTDPEHIHICLEGNYGEAEQLPGLPERQQQLFLRRGSLYWSCPGAIKCRRLRWSRIVKLAPEHFSVE